MTAVVPITVRRRRCSDRLSDSNRFAPWQERRQRTSQKVHNLVLSGGLELRETDCGEIP